MLTVISVHNWQYKWEKTLKDPNNLFFSTSIVNIAPYVLERIDFELSRIPWGSRRNPQRLQKKLPSRYQKMLELIFDIASSDNIEAKILQIAAPSSIKYLKKFAKQPKQAQQPQRNLKTIRYHLNEIINIYNSAVFVIAPKRLTLQLMNEKHSPNYVIPWLARALLSRYPEEFIKNAAGESFSQSFAELYKIQIHDSIRKSRCISEQMDPAYRDLLVAVCDTLKPLSGQSLQDYCDALFQDRRRWRTDLHFLYKSYCNLLIKHNQKIDNLLHKKVKESQKAIRSKIPAVMANNLKLLVKEMVRIVILNIIIKCLLDEYQDTQGIHNLSKTPYPSEVSAVIKAESTVKSNPRSVFHILRLNHRFGHLRALSFLPIDQSVFQTNNPKRGRPSCQPCLQIL